MSHAEPQKFYVTTPIYYVNARPHIGHAYTTVVADVLARRHRLLGHPTFFLTGTDEHGQKIERSAAQAGIPPQQFADQVSAQFRDLWDRMGLTYDRYIRTTSDPHKQGAQHLFAELFRLGHIYLSSYTGSYCVSDEAFVDLPAGTPCPDCGRPLETVTEENFFFRLSSFQRPLLDLIESNTLRITPEASRNEVLSFLRGDLSRAQTNSSSVSSRPERSEAEGPASLPQTQDAPTPHLAQTAAGTPYLPGALKDLSISRSSFTWGIPVPQDIQRAAEATQPHVIYVWFDALANYMTAIGYGQPTPEAQAEFEKWWPADLHLVGKEITRFHCVYWPALLLAAGLPTPKQITANGWLLFDNSKMSKSKGNVVRTETILDAFGQHYRTAIEIENRKRIAKGDVTDPPIPLPNAHDQDLFAADVLRYYLLREIPFGQDGSFSFEALVTRYNADLANGYGNLVSRVLRMVEKYFSSFPPTMPSLHEALGRDQIKYLQDMADTVVNSIRSLAEESATLFKKQEFAALTQAIADSVSVVDTFITATAPWITPPVPIEFLEQTTLNRRAFILAHCDRAIQAITALLHPILPYTTAKVWAQLGLGSIEEAAQSGQLKDLHWGGLQPGTRLGPLSPIFPRAEKSLAQTMTDMENQNTPAQPSASKPDLTAVNAHHNASHPDRSPFPEAPIASAAATTEVLPATLTDELVPNTPTPSDPTSPAAGPRSLSPADPGTTVAGSHSTTTERPATPHHTDTPGSGIFAGGPIPVAPHLTTAAAPAPEPDAPSLPKGETGSTTPETSPEITIDDFAKIDLRVAEVLLCEHIPKADKLLRLEVDLGPELGRRQILSGIAEHYTPESLVGRRIVVITNLAPRKMRGLVSHGMLLAATDPATGKPILATMAETTPPGARLK